MTRLRLNVSLRGLPIREDDPAPLIGMNSTGLAGFKLDGILGYALLARYKIEIDFTKPYLVWTEQSEVPKSPMSLKLVLKGRPAPSMKGVENLESIAKSAGSFMPKGTFTPPLKGNYGLLLDEREKSVVVIGAIANSTAARAGFFKGDIIATVTIGEREPRDISNMVDLRTALDIAIPGQTVAVTVNRNGKTISLDLKWPGKDF